MTDWQLVWLAVMAVSLAIMTAIQIGLIIAALKIARQAGAVLEDVRREIKPLVAKVNRIADDAGRATSLAALQVERVDQFISATTTQIDQAMGLVSQFIGGPVRQGAAFFTALRAVFSLFQARQSAGRPSASRGRDARDEDDAMFVG